MGEEGKEEPRGSRDLSYNMLKMWLKEL